MLSDYGGNMKSLKPVMTAYIILSIIVFLIEPILLMSFGGFYVGFGLLLIWIYATGILIIIQSLSLIRTKKVAQMVFGSILLAIGLALVIFGYIIVNMIFGFIFGGF
jgi:hypothetical protein